MNAPQLKAALEADPKNFDLFMEATNYIQDRLVNVDTRPPLGESQMFYVGILEHGIDPRLEYEDRDLWVTISRITEERRTRMLAGES